MNAQELDHLATLVAEKVGKKPPFEKTILTADESAEYLKCSKGYLINQLQHKVGFPRPFRFKQNGQPKWLGGDLYKWAEKKKI